MICITTKTVREGGLFLLTGIKRILGAMEITTTFEGME